MAFQRFWAKAPRRSHFLTSKKYCPSIAARVISAKPQRYRVRVTRGGAKDYDHMHFVITRPRPRPHLCDA